MIPQKLITNHKEIADRVMKHIWGKEGFEWDRGSASHRSFMTWAQRNFKRLKKLQWLEIYTEARKRLYDNL
jgi:hypothetical protein